MNPNITEHVQRSEGLLKKCQFLIHLSVTHLSLSTSAQDPIQTLFAEKLSQYTALSATEGNMVGISEEAVAKQQAYLERLKKMYVVNGEIEQFPQTNF